MPASNSSVEPTLYEILSLTPKSLEGQDPPTQTKAVKQAYRAALLKHHPDKNQQAKSQSEGTANSKTATHYTVDQITHAYTVLSDSKQRREYTRSLQTRTRTTTTSSSTRNGKTTTRTQCHSFQTGVETVDLDDLSWDGKRGVYYWSCRCGNPRGFCFREMDLDEVGEEGELMVECAGCSLWLKVLFEEVEDDEDAEGTGQQVQSSNSNSGEKVVQRGSAEGKTGGWSWKFNFGISIGGSAGINATAGRS
ncbi:uncharacterized protein BCR38DRAFT_347075 [Pseudomassariella vexata]|uniref:Diphthamide biosynthesis protein 4 n=1 Tax=Pseudomassariella vexata TaxID=1141098 RepID=A0A1Y2DSS8_9PEZI|nr:uncharacterized protein BCR38DRAFT_347075 [Pseudomassariella vexata]ORY62331.1 hypothetical protein BCR38DRAFT_347075 [Pseudomassariella vexata]